MQKLQAKLKNVPTDASQVCSSTSLSLNKDQSLSVIDKVLTCNNPEVNQHQQHTDGLKDRVYVISIDGKPLMPCSPTKARKLLKTNKAVIFKMYPFTIQLTFECENVVQDVTLGIDTGYGNIGFSVVSEKDELISGTLKLDGKTKERLDDRRGTRRSRRRRHHWYRKCRFLNRKKKEGWLPPSIQRRYDTHLRLIKLIQSILPINKIRIEIAKFDIQKLITPDIQGIEYQQGDMYEYQNTRSYLMSREKGLCEHCKKDFKNNPSHIHHRKGRSKQGSNRLCNLMLVHEKCHELIHKKPELLRKYEKSSIKEYKQSTFMSIINKRFYKDVENLEVTFGYITFVNRNKLGLEKTHYNDAFVIVGGTTQNRCKTIEITQKHRNNRKLQIQKLGRKPAIRRRRYNIQPGDLVWINGKKYISNGLHSFGRYIHIKNDPTPHKMKLVKNIEKVYHFGSFCCK